uniref:Uncharacterized protein n=1 Tax=Cacopsylla melanoneura TaxID=428564 RepID=A0A8D8W5T1_9HEMI
MSVELHHLFSIYPIQENLLKYLNGNDLQALSSLGGEYESSYFEFNRELELDHYDDELYSKFKKIQKLKLNKLSHQETVPTEKLSVLLSLEVPSINTEKINLRECKRLQRLCCESLVNLDKEDFPISLKQIYCNKISDINLNHLINLKETKCGGSLINDDAINNFPKSLERIKRGCWKISAKLENSGNKPHP